MTYRSARSGRQFVVIAAGGKPKSGQSAAKILAYALP
jgi:glucose dehydrogenase